MKIKLTREMVTGYCLLNKHLHRMGMTDSPLCKGYRVIVRRKNTTPRHLAMRSIYNDKATPTWK